MRAELILRVASMIVIVVSLPLALNKVPKNQFYGVRTKRTMAESDAQWYKVNHAAGIAMLVAGGANLLLLAVLARLPIQETTVVYVDVAALVALLLGGLWFASTRQG